MEVSEARGLLLWSIHLKFLILSQQVSTSVKGQANTPGSFKYNKDLFQLQSTSKISQTNFFLLESAIATILFEASWKITVDMTLNMLTKINSEVSDLNNN